MDIESPLNDLIFLKKRLRGLDLDEGIRIECNNKEKIFINKNILNQFVIEIENRNRVKKILFLDKTNTLISLIKAKCKSKIELYEY